MSRRNSEYELWKAIKGEQKLIGEYNTFAQLQRSWRRHYDGFALTAYRIVGGERVAIGDMMPKKYAGLREYTSPEERDQAIIGLADHFTVVRFLGVGQYERHKRSSQKEAERLAGKLAKQSKGNYMIYAVTGTGRSAFVKTIFGNR